MPLRILPLDLLKTSSINLVYGTAQPGYPAANGLTARRSEVARATPVSAGGGFYVTRTEYTLAAASRVNCVVVARSAASSTGYADVSLLGGGGALLASSLNNAARGGNGQLDTLADDTARGLNNMVAYFSPVQTAVQAIRVDQLTQSSALTEHARVMAGEYRELAWNFNWGYSLSQVDPSSASLTYGGDQIVSYGGPGRRRLDLPFDGLTEADIQYLFDLVRVAGKTGELFISAWPGYNTAPTLEQRTQMWCRIVEIRGFENPLVGYHGTGIVFEEC